MRHKYKLETFFNKDHISYYLLGVIATDGCLYTNKNYDYEISIGSKDYDWIVLINNLICPDKPPINRNSNFHVIRIRSKKLFNWILAQGITPNKSLTLQMPLVPEKYLPDFIRGCMDGDGCISHHLFFNKKKNRKEKRIMSYLCGSSLSFLESIRLILNEKTIKHSFYERKELTSKIHGKLFTRKNKHYRIIMCKNSSIKLLEWIYYPGYKLAMPRKENIARQIIKLV